ncbi:ATP-binding protein [Streptomyces sp. NPDC102406]|uniref:ATP-binding protein n=1 Tax=Streptomyces sp. NPDC102406 TaxID=3366171 RepID=UPI00381B7A1A
MIIPLRKQAADERGTGEHATLHSSVAWDSGTASAADARRVLRAFLTRAPQVDCAPAAAQSALDAELVVSELITNAIRHAPGPCGLILHLSAGRLAITVWDTSPGEPVMQSHDPRRAGGHGLRLVYAVSDHVGVTPKAGGKQVTAHLPLTGHQDTSTVDKAVVNSLAAEAPHNPPPVAMT